MSGMMRDFGRAEILGAEAVGEPGARRFRLFARGRRGETASLWMEKEQLDALAVAMERLLAHASGRMALRREASADPPPPPSAPADFPEQAAVEFVVGQLQIGYALRPSNRCWAMISTQRTSSSRSSRSPPRVGRSRT
jgi:hypothetical protein